ncbi:MAG: glycosyltransferase family 39 protein [Opitutaceae bacterium]|jgi:4-amino-4-deoxy-L-arabinose transferase-like glycosyltransferase
MPGYLRRPWVAALLVVLALGLYWSMAVSVSSRMGVTADEVVHLTGGYSYWTLNDYRLHPENGNLAQRIAALPLLALDLKFPPLDDPDWTASKVNLVGEKFFFHQGNDVKRMLLFSRMMIAFCGVFVVWLTWRWAKGLFGPKAGWLALGLAVFCPALLAHGGLATSDMVMTACTLGALSSVWLLLNRATWGRLGLAALACGLAFLSKMSGVIIVPIIVVLVLVRSFYPAPVVLALGRVRWLRKTGTKLLATVLLMSVVAVGSLVVLWAGFGFRYSGFNPGRTPASGYYFSWDIVLSKAPLPGPNGTSLDQLLPERSAPKQTPLDRLVEWTHNHHLLPEAYLWGFAQTTKFSRYRPAYLMGRLETQGWVEFFPLAFLLKTPPSTLILGATGLAALLWTLSTRKRKASPTRAWAYRATPLIVFFILYWLMALTMNLNIGHRHILPTYPVFYIMASASVLWLTTSRRRMIAVGLIAAVSLHAGESLLTRPFYLSYFQSLVGGTDRGYRYLVDSSFDWGQGLPDLETWLADQHRNGDQRPVYLSYFGADSPRARHLDVIRFGDEINDNGPRVFPVPLTAGWYVISATNFVQAYTMTRGPWTQTKEDLYNEIRRRHHSPQAQNPKTPDERAQVLHDCMDLELMQSARLFTYLKNRTPHEIIGGSLLVFYLTDLEIQEALYKPFPGN